MDPFAVLGVRPDASPAEVRRAFADGVRAAHPDAGGSAVGAAERLARLIQARDAALLGGGERPVRSPVWIYQRIPGLERLVELVVGGLSGEGWERPDGKGG